jgi:hypothetical protein
MKITGVLMLTAALTLPSCTNMTAEDREALRETGYIATRLTIETLHVIGLGTIEISPEGRAIANLACKLLALGGPILTQVINSNIADQAEPVTLEEYMLVLDNGCTLLALALDPAAPVESPLPVPSPGDPSA